MNQWKERAQQAIASGSGAAELIESAHTLPMPEDDWVARMLLGILHGQTGLIQEAVTNLRIAAAGNPENPDIVFFLGHFHARQFGTIHKSWAVRRDHAKQALQLVESGRAPANWPQLKLCLETLAEACINIGPSIDVEYACGWLLKIDPNNARYYAWLSQARADDDPQEAVDLLDKARALDPSMGDSQEIEFSRQALRNASRRAPVARAKFPSNNDMRGDIVQAIRKTLLQEPPRERFIQPGSRFFTLGSCFAREIAIRLQQRSFQVNYLEVVEHINSTFANRSMVDWAFEECTGQTKDRLDELFSALRVTPSGLRAAWSSTDIFIYTLGVAPAFFDRESGEFVMPSHSMLASQAFAQLYDFRTSSVQQNLDNLFHIEQRIRSVNPRMRFVVTVSPVPLRTSFEFKSALQADCISKSILRVVAHEFVSQRAGAVYWPSFEVVRWIGGHVGPFYGVDDDSPLHVGDEVVQAITDLFIEFFSS